MENIPDFVQVSHMVKEMVFALGCVTDPSEAVSYTHLDVYKRQAWHRNVKLATRVRFHTQERTPSANVPTKMARSNKFLSAVCAENSVCLTTAIELRGSV